MIVGSLFNLDEQISSVVICYLFPVEIFGQIEALSYIDFVIHVARGLIMTRLDYCNFCTEVYDRSFSSAGALLLNF